MDTAGSELGVDRLADGDVVHLSVLTGHSYCLGRVAWNA